jgi:hypothetical protein
MCKPADDAIAAREVGGMRGCAKRKFGNNDAVRGDLVRKLAMARRIYDIETGSDDGDAAGRARQAAAVCCGINADGKPADDGQAGVAQRFGECLGVRAALRGSAATAHNGERVVVQQCMAAFDVEQRRRIRSLQQRPGICGVGEGDDMVIAVFQPGGHRGQNLVAGAAGMYGAGDVLRNHPAKRGKTRGKYLLRSTEGREQFSDGRIAYARDEAQAQPRLKVFFKRHGYAIPRRAALQTEY